MQAKCCIIVLQNWLAKNTLHFLLDSTKIYFEYDDIGIKSCYKERRAIS